MRYRRMNVGSWARQLWVRIFFTPKATEFCTHQNLGGETNHIDLSSVLEYDTFPATSTKFYALAARDGGYALAWSQTSYPLSPPQGSPTATARSTRPTAAATPTTALGRRRRRPFRLFRGAKGHAPLSADADGDGLSDAEELIRKTDRSRPTAMATV
jgi:hypothetical protein